MRIRIDKESNYKSVFFNRKTIRMRLDSSKPILAPKFAEIEDVAINSKCLAACSYCYTDAKKSGINFSNISDKAKFIWGERELNDRPFQIAIGGAGESTLHLNWIDFVKTVNNLDIMPNYTTNGMHTTKSILDATEKYCGGVAVSYHPHIEKIFHKSIIDYSKIQTVLNTHIILSDEKSLEDLKILFYKYQSIIKYFVILPYQNFGRGKIIDTEKTFKDCFEWLSTLNIKEQNKFAFGALFYDFMLNNKIKLDVDIYEPEIYSGYRIFDDSFMFLRNSSYDLKIKN